MEVRGGQAGAPPEPGDDDEGIGVEPPPWRVHPRPQATWLVWREKGGARPSDAPDLAAAAATNPGGEVGPLAMLDDNRNDRSEGSAGHPTKALPPAEINLEGGAAAAVAEA